jgi:malate dehydrogenase (oxaloacetate-decarboxylating)(NADP+)
MGLSLDGAEIVDPRDEGVLGRHAEHLYELRSRRGVTPQTARRLLRARPVLGLAMLSAGAADGLVGGLGRPYVEMLRPTLEIIGPAPGVARVAGCIVALFPGRTIVFADTTVNPSPDADDLAAIAVQACEVARLFDVTPRVAFLSFSNFGDSRHPDAARPRRAAALFRELCPGVASDGEMHPDVALNAEHAATFFPHSAVQGDANVLVVPDLDAGLIAYKVVKELARVDVIGPLLAGLAHPVNILNYAADVDDIVRFAALTSLAAAERGRAAARAPSP